MPSTTNNNFKGGTTNPSIVAKGVNGNASVMNNDIKLSVINNLPGLLLISDFRVRITNKMSNSVQTDSMNQPV